MNISATNCSPIKPQTSFGNGATDFAEAERVMDLSKEISDSFNKKGQDPEQKNATQTAVSVAGAFAMTFLAGKVLAGKILTACPNLLEKSGDIAKKTVSKLKTIQVPDKIKNSKILTNEKMQKVANKATELAGKAADGAKAYVEKHTLEGAVKNAAGLASAIALGSQVVKVDGNKDGVADIAQENVNAYKNAVKNMAIVGEIAEALV